MWPFSGRFSFWVPFAIHTKVGPPTLSSTTPVPLPAKNPRRVPRLAAQAQQRLGHGPRQDPVAAEGAEGEPKARGEILKPEREREGGRGKEREGGRDRGTEGEGRGGEGRGGEGRGGEGEGRGGEGREGGREGGEGGREEEAFEDLDVASLSL